MRYVHSTRLTQASMLRACTWRMGTWPRKHVWQSMRAHMLDVDARMGARNPCVHERALHPASNSSLSARTDA